MFAARTRALLLLSTPILAAAAEPPPSCLNVDRGQADGGDNACFEDDDVGMVCGWDGTPQEAYCTPRADGKKVCARWSAGGKCPEGSAVPDAACHDGGPFECKEEGCPPSGVVTCAELADACPARFDQVYDSTLPPGVNAAKLEAHLSEGQFEQVLGMGRAEFYAMSKVEQMRCKQEVGLF